MSGFQQLGTSFMKFPEFFLCIEQKKKKNNLLLANSCCFVFPFHCLSVFSFLFLPLHFHCMENSTRNQRSYSRRSHRREYFRTFRRCNLFRCSARPKRYYRCQILFLPSIKYPKKKKKISLFCWIL